MCSGPGGWSGGSAAGRAVWITDNCPDCTRSGGEVNDVVMPLLVCTAASVVISQFLQRLDGEKKAGLDDMLW